MKLLTEKSVVKITSLSCSTIWRLEKSGFFPKRIKVSKRAVRWIESEITNWINHRIQNRKHQKGEEQ